MTESRPPRPPWARPHVADSNQAGGPVVSSLRPYVLTSGRVQPIDNNLEMEAQVLVTEHGLSSFPFLSFEHRDIVGLCRTPVSVAEVAAKLGLHVGVARVLVADLAALGHLVVQRPSLSPSQDPVLIERVIRGLEAIR